MHSRGRPTARASCRWTQPRCPTSCSRADALRATTSQLSGRHSKQLSSFFPLFERRCCTPSPPVILDAPDSPRRELDRDPDDRPQVADEAPLIAAFARLLHRGLLRLSLVA